MNYYFNAAMVSGNLLSNEIINLTKSINDVVGKTPVDKFMDSVSGIGHRVKHGHDLSYLPEILEKFGINGVVDFFKHNAKDFMSPHGVPIPFADNIREVLGMSYKQSIDWFSINVGKLFSGGFSLAHSYYVVQSLLAANATGAFSSELLINTAIGGAFKLTSLAWAPNPITLISGVTDLGTLAYVLAPYLLQNGSIPLMIEHTTFELICSGTLKGMLISLAIGVPIELGKQYYRSIKGEKFNDLAPEFISATIGLAISGAIAGFTSSIALILSSVPLISVVAGAGVYGASTYVYKKQLKKKFTDKIKNKFFKEKLYVFEDGTVIDKSDFEKLDSFHKNLDEILNLTNFQLK